MFSLFRELHRNELMVQTGGVLVSARYMGLDLVGIALGSTADFLYGHVTHLHLCSS